LICSSKEPTYRKIIDLGTGSGCIALALKKEFPGAVVKGLDLNRKVLDVAAKNAKNNQLDVEWMVGDLHDIPAISQQMDREAGFDLVVSNPPYVRESEKELMDNQVVNHEPYQALFVQDQDPLLYYRTILAFSITFLLPGGHLWVEINEKLGRETASLIKKEGFSRIKILKDIHGKDRFIHARK
jgi:release factor glutamine methyltransferase